MANAPTKTTTIQNLLKEGAHQARLQQIFEMGQPEMAKIYINNLLNDSSYRFAAEAPFEMKFPTKNGEAIISFSNNRVVISEKKKIEEKTALTDRIKNGTAPIREIESALESGDLQYKDFKEATEHLEPHVSEYYRLLLTHENKVYETKDGPAIKVTMHDGSLYTTEEKQREKETREKIEGIESGHHEPDHEDIRTILLGMQRPVSLEQQVIFNYKLMNIISYLGNVTDESIMNDIAGNYEHLGILIKIENGKLVLHDEDEFHREVQETIDR